MLNYSVCFSPLQNKCKSVFLHKTLYRVHNIYTKYSVSQNCNNIVFGNYSTNSSHDLQWTLTYQCSNHCFWGTLYFWTRYTFNIWWHWQTNGFGVSLLTILTRGNMFLSILVFFLANCLHWLMTRIETIFPFISPQPKIPF